MGRIGGTDSILGVGDWRIRLLMSESNMGVLWIMRQQ